MGTTTTATATSPNLPWLYAGRALRGVSTAFLTVVFPLYLAASGYGATRLGLALSLSGVVTVGLVAVVGWLADRYGRRTMILALAALSALGGFALAVFPPALPLVVLASGLGGVGRGGGAGSGGAWGPMFPAEQPLVAASAPPDRRVEAFGRLSFVGVLAAAVGSLLAGLPALLATHGVPTVTGYRLLFALAGVLGLGTLAVTLPIREPLPHPSQDAASDRGVMPFGQLVGRLGLTNALNGFGFGFLGPLLSYWFYRRFGVGADAIGGLYTVVNLAAALPYLTAARLARRLGEVRTVVWTRGVSVLVLGLLPLLPSFWWAGLAYTVRMGLNSLGMPARQSFTMRVADERYRSRVAAFGSLPSQATSMLSPGIGGALMEISVNLPLFAAAFFMLANVVAYAWAFGRVAPDVSGATRPGAAPPA
ncbi:MAG: MFS transporter [Actinomycetia bacterium]|nr:MFS transporter [Actinomycetes bacterium]